MKEYQNWTENTLKPALVSVSFSKDDLQQPRQKLAMIADGTRKFNERGKDWARLIAKLRRGVAILGAAVGTVHLADKIISIIDEANREALISATIEFVNQVVAFEYELARVDYRLEEVNPLTRQGFASDVTGYLNQLVTINIIDATTAHALSKQVWQTLGT